MMGYGFGTGFGMIFVVLFWVALIVGAVWLVGSLLQNGRSQPPGSGRGQSARDILDERYERGEITREQYEQMKLDLR